MHTNEDQFEALEGDDEEMPATERELADDAQWKLIQKNTFTRWANEHLKTVNKHMANLETDLADGLRLVALVEVLSGKKFTRVNKRPNFRTQKLENVTMSLKFLEEDEGIRIVNIDSSDIVDQRLKLILGLIWTLILHYSISMPMWEGEDEAPKSDQTPKQRLLAWIQSKVPDQPINNFTSDWNDGRAVGALVDAIAPGLCPDWEDWNPKNAKANAKEAMEAAEQWLDVPQLIRPEEMTNPKVDELSMMTYLAQFPNAKVKPGAPLRPRTNPARVRAYGPGIEPAGNSVGAPARFTVETFSAGRGEVTITILNPKGVQEKCEIHFNNDRNLTYSCVYTPTMEGQYRVIIKFAGKEIPKSPFQVTVEGAAGDASKCSAAGPGIERTGVQINKKTYFEVFTKDAGFGHVDVAVLDPHGRKDTIKATVIKRSEESWYVEYTAKEEGLHSVNVFFAGKAIPNSPYGVGVSKEGKQIDPSKLPAPKGCPPVDGALGCASPRMPGVMPPREAPEPAAPSKQPPAKKPQESVPDGAQLSGKAAAGKTAPPPPTKKPVQAEPIQPELPPYAQQAPGRRPSAGKAASQPQNKTPVQPDAIQPELPPHLQKAPARKLSDKGAPQPNAKLAPQPEKIQPELPPYAKQPPARRPSAGKAAPQPQNKTPVQPESVEPELPPYAQKAPYRKLPGKTEPSTPAKKPVQDDISQPDSAPYAQQPPRRRPSAGKAAPQPQNKTPVKPETVEPVKTPYAQRPSAKKPDETVPPYLLGPGFKKLPTKKGTAPPNKTPVEPDTIQPDQMPRAQHAPPGKAAPPPKAKVPVEEAIQPTAAPPPPYAAAKPKGKPKPAVDAKKCYATGRGIQPKGVRVRDNADFKVHTEGAGEGELKVTVTGPGGVEEKVRIKKISATVYECIYVPSKPGPYVINITYGGQHIQKSPFKVEVGKYVESKIRAYGPGLETGVVGYSADFVVETNGETGALGFSIEGPSQAKIDCKDNGDGSADISYWPTVPGEYAIHILCNEEDIPNSPYMAQISPATKEFDPTKVTASGPGLEKTGVTVNKWAEFTVDTRRAGAAPLAVSCLDSDYNPVDVIIKDNKDGTFFCRYMPKRNVKHTIIITYGGVNIPTSPYRVMVQEASNPAKVKVYGPGVEKGNKTFQPTFFTVDCTQAGPGDVAIALTDERGLDVPVKTTDNKDNTFRIEYEPKTVGQYTASVFFADQEIPSSPYKINIQPSIDVSKVKVQGLEPSVFLESTTEFTVDAKSVTPKGEGKVKTFVTAPSGTRTEALVNNNQDGTYKVMYAPFEQGPHKIDVTYEGLQIPKSPFPVKAVPGCDPKRVRAYGPGLDGGVTHTPQIFTVETKGAGQGGLGLAIEGPSEAKMTCRDNRDGSCTVEYLPTKPGDYDINIKFADKDIPGSPFGVKIKDEVNPKKVRAYGSGIDAKGVRANQPAVFTVDASEAGEAPLEVITTDQKGNKTPAQLTPRGDGVFDCTYYPEVEGKCKVDVNYANQAIPKSPFTTRILPAFDASKVRVEGPGIKNNLPASVPVTFTIDTREAGMADLDVVIQDPEGNYVRPKIVDNGDGTFAVTYTPEDVGRYNVKVKFGGQDVPKSPFNVRANPTGDASKVKIQDGMRTTVPVGEECVITLNCSEAGMGNITCRIHSTSGSDVDIDIVDNGDGTISIIYTPNLLGAYTVNIKFGGQPVPNGVFTQQAINPEECAQFLEEELLLAQEAERLKAGGVPIEEDLIAPDTVDAVECAPGVGPGAGKYNPVDFVIPVGPVFNFVSAEITTPSGKKQYPKIEDNGDGTVKVRYQPSEVGRHLLTVKYNNEEIPGSPFIFHVDPIKAGYVTAYGPGLSHGIAGQPCEFTIVTKDAGAGGLALAVEGPSKAEIQCKDNKDGTCSVSYLPTAPGEYSVIIKFADKLISGAPFTAKITGEGRQKAQLSVGTSSEVSLKVTESDLSNLTASIRAPSGKEEPCVLKRLANGHLGISFTPHEKGDHYVNVFRNGKHIANSPFKIEVGETEIGNASKVKVTGKGLVEGMANEVNEFTVNTKDAGYGGLSLSIEGPSKADIECFDNEDQSCRVTYKPTEPGNYIVNVKFADEHVPGSPFLVKIGGIPSSRMTERITRQREAADVTHIGSQCELSLKIPGTSPFDMEASVTSPSGVTERCDINALDDNTYSIKFVPKEMGIHTVSVKHKGIHIPGSPFQFTVGPITEGGSHKVRAAGPGLERGEVNQPNEFNIYTREAGAGGLSIAVEGPSKAEIDFQDRKDGSCGVTYTCTEPGEYLTSVKFNDQHIPDSPFKVYISPSVGDARKLTVDSMEQQNLQVNQPAAFTIQLNGAKGKLDARVVAPSGAEDEAIIQEIDQDHFAVRFIPRENGVHYVHVRLNGSHMPGSPFRVLVGKVDADPGMVHAYGDGLTHGETGKQCKFIVNTVNAGSGALAVTVDGPSKVQLTCKEVSEGYEFTYTPTAPGDYLITIKYAGNVHIAGSPFKARITGSVKPGQVAWNEQSQVVVETVTKTSTTQQFAGVQQFKSDASKVVSRGVGLQKATMGKETNFTVDTKDAGMNVLMVGMMGPHRPCEEVHIKHIGRNQYSVSYIVKERGDYMLIVKWGDEHVPGSPYHVKVQ